MRNEIRAHFVGTDWVYGALPVWTVFPVATQSTSLGRSGSVAQDSEGKYTVPTNDTYSDLELTHRPSGP